MNFNYARNQRLKRNESGLSSVSGIPYREDNRQIFLSEKKQNVAEYRNFSNSTTNAGKIKQQERRPTDFHSSSDERYKPKSYVYSEDFGCEGEKRNQDNVHRESKAFHKQENTENYEARIQQSRHSMNEKYQQHSEILDRGPEEHQHTDSRQHMMNAPLIRLENSKFTQNSQFHNETIYYPGSKNSISDSDKGPFSKTDPQSADSSFFPSTWHSSDGFFDEDFFEDLEEIPSYDEIPYALIITGNIDKSLLQKSMKKQKQIDALKEINEKSGKKADEKVIIKNKNQIPLATRGSGNKKSKEQDFVSRYQYNDGDILLSENKNDYIFPDKNLLGSCKQTHGYGHIEIKEPVSDTLILDDNNSVAHFSLTSIESNTNSLKDVESVEALTEIGQIKKKDTEASVHPKEEFLKSASIKTRSSDSGNNEEKTSFVSNESRKGNKRIEYGKLERYERDMSTKEETHEREREIEVIRQMRLKKLLAKQTFVDNSVKRTHTPDNREISFNPNIIHSPVKSKAFRSKIPNFTSDQSTSGDHKVCSADKPPSPTLDTKVSLQADNNDKVKLPIKINSLKDEKEKLHGISIKNNDEEGKTETKRNCLNGKNEQFSKRTHGNTNVNELGEEDGTYEPVAMKLIRTQQGLKKPSMYNSLHSRQSEQKDEQNDEEMVEPSAMRFLRKSKETKDKEAKLQGLLQKVKTDSKSDVSYGLPLFIELVGTLLGGKSSSVPKGGSPKLYDLEKSATQQKSVNKNKNKNVSLVLKEDQERSFTKRNETEETGLLKGITEQEYEERDKMYKEEGTDTYPYKQMAIICFADKRHKAFQNIKMAKSEESLKCTACGRPECQGFNINKMKEIIRFAKQAGFEVRDVIPDGNCMFASVVDQLQLYGDFNFGPKSLREAAVSWLIEHPHSDDGTHYSSFLAEDWDVYLQRMINEGEWGDHLILRAIVETIGHTIKILNVSGGKSHWTIIEPATIDVSKDGMHLVLGHVGEFHYTSLRPAEEESRSYIQDLISPTSHSLTCVDNRQISLEGTETIEMFQEDYIDLWSDMPSAHFSYLLKRIIPIKVLDKAAVIASQYIDKCSEGKMAFNISGYETENEYAGSVFEGVYVPYLNETINTDCSTDETFEIEVYAILKNFRIITQRRELMHDSQIQVCEIEDSGVHVGYTKLLRRVSDGQDGYSRHLPQINLASSESILYFDRFIALRCPVWPDCAKSWISRERREGWPQKDTIQAIESDGCLLIPKAHKDSKCPDIEWQFWFALSEKKLFRDALSLYQKYSYILFSAFCTQTLRHCKSITSSHLKSVFFYACERIPSEYWESCPGACVLYMLDELLRYVKTRSLPNYFISTHNMIDHLTDRELTEIEEKIVLLRSQPVLFLRQINESLQQSPCSNSIIDKVSDDFSSFKEHRSLKRSTLEIFIPATIETAHHYIRSRQYGEGYDFLSQAFQERLSVSTCDDSVPFQMFLPGAVSGLDLDSLVWFSAYTDRQLEGQMSKSLVRETCGDLELVKIKDILPASIVGSYGNTEVPMEFSRTLCSFCHDFAKFLYETNKISEILPILYHCHNIFVQKTEVVKTVQVSEGKKGEDDLNDFTDETMFNIYTAMFTVYKRQCQIEFLRAVLPSIQGIVDRIHTRWAYNCICIIYQALGDDAQLQANSSVYFQLPEDPLEQTRVATFSYWPRNVYVMK